MPNTTSNSSGNAQYSASVIISVYKDIDNLKAILHALNYQSLDAKFEVIVSEDGSDESMRSFVENYSSPVFDIVHLTQEDRGFRKNRALNRAVAKASSNQLLFLDGDCVPHTQWLESHLTYLKKGTIGVGRRVELGPRYSRLLKENNDWIVKLSSPIYYLIHTLPALIDGAHHYESGYRFGWLHRMSQGRKPSLLGCNFSCHKDDLISVNGFNEHYQSPGYGEDSDIEFRLRKVQVNGVNLKFYAQVFHLYHKKLYTVTDQNMLLYKQTTESQSIMCESGIDQYL